MTTTAEPAVAAVESQSTTPPPPEELRRLAHRRVVPLRHPARWIAAALVLVLLANFGQTLFTNPQWEWHKLAKWFFSPAIVTGLRITIIATLVSAVVSFAAGIVLAVARLSPNPVLSGLSWFYIWLFRSLPIILVLIFLYHSGSLYPTIGVGVPFGPQVELATFNEIPDIALGIIGLSLVETAFSAEIVRAGILSVDQGQHEAAKALGISRRRQFSRIVLPQALRSIVPSYVNQVVNLIKASSLLFYVSVLDLFGVVQNLGSTYPGDVIPLLVVATLWYLILTSLISVVQYYVERFYARGAFRVLPPTPFQRVKLALASIGARR